MQAVFKCWRSSPAKDKDGRHYAAYCAAIVLVPSLRQYWHGLEDMEIRCDETANDFFKRLVPLDVISFDLAGVPQVFKGQTTALVPVVNLSLVDSEDVTARPFRVISA